MKQENELWPQDEELFSNMANNYQSEAEAFFFAMMRNKMETENAPWKETLIWEQDNPDQIYFLREGYDEFIVGRGSNPTEWYDTECHTMNLSEALNLNLSQAKILDRDISLLDWLREQDYACVKYNHENDGN